MNVIKVLSWAVVIGQVVVGVQAFHWQPWRINLANSLRPNSLQLTTIPPRGGASSEDDKERYSRQEFTLGARAHSLVRAATIYVDGPSRSGLVYETIKNLALSGVGQVFIVTSDEEIDCNYHTWELDDLGQTYMRGALAELGVEDKTLTPSEMMAEYTRRLNPTVKIQIVRRGELERVPLSGTLLSVDRPYETQRRLNHLARNNDMAFVAVETAGVYGRVFSDFGPAFEVHDVDGETPAVVPIDRVEILDKEEGTMKLHSVSGEKHDVSTGDEIRFQNSRGEAAGSSCFVSNVATPEQIVIKLTSPDKTLEEFTSEVNAEAFSFSRVKNPTTLSFCPIEDAVHLSKSTSSLFTSCDLDKSHDETRTSTLFGCFQALSSYVQEHLALPRTTDFDGFAALAKAACTNDHVDHASWTTHCKNFVKTCAAKFVPIQSIFGAIAAQECLKAASGVYNPIHQFLLYDCDEVLSSSDPNSGLSDGTCKESGLEYILGREVGRRLQQAKIFVVGAGAIGCELLKNLAGLGAGTRQGGKVSVTDMDTIERSNLSRQLLFRDNDIGKFKSMAAQEAVARLNPAVNMVPHTSKVGINDQGPFDGNFWSRNVDVVLNALDNVEARLHIDGRCVANEKALVDAGTLGSKGNVQVVVPHQSESYSSSTDPPEPAIPVCTLKNFPYSISHTIQWGRDLFDGLFVRRPKQANDYVGILVDGSTDALRTKLEQDMGHQAALDAALELSEDLAMVDSNMEIGRIRETAIEWAAALAEDLFSKAIKALLKSNPAGSLDDDGNEFWSGGRRMPSPLVFSPEEKGHPQQEQVDKNWVQFVRHAARLRMETVLGPATEKVGTLVSIDEVEDFLARQKLVSSELGRNPKTNVTDSLQTLASFSGPFSRLHQTVEFEKDDTTNGHVGFVAAASNLRAICYGIPPTNEMETRRVAGKIVPAMITTTALVSALSCIELIKLVQVAPLHRHRNAFINLALPFFAFTPPIEVEEFEGLPGQAYTIWDKITIRDQEKESSKGGLTLRHFMKRLLREINLQDSELDISTISLGQYMIYSNFLHDKEDDLLDTELWVVAENAVTSGSSFESEFSRNMEDVTSDSFDYLGDSASLSLTVVVEDRVSGDEFELPPVVVLSEKMKRPGPD